MQLFVKNGAVVAWYLDEQTVPADAHPGTALQSYTGEMSALARFGDLPEGWPVGEPDPRPYAAPPIDLVAYAAAARYTRETAGIIVGNAPIATDRESQVLITGAWAAAQINPNITLQFKTAAGFVQLAAAQVQTIAAAVVAHVQACFAAEAKVTAAITAGTVTTAAQVDAAFAAVTA